jgi:hypothetical protein
MKITKAPIVFALMYAATADSIAARPSTTASQKDQATVLDTVVPKEFGGWRELPEQGAEASLTPFPTEQQNQATMW